MNTKDKIAQTALELFNEKGCGEVTTNHIAAACGISPGNLYYHYKNKQEIIARLFDDSECNFDLAMQAHLGMTPSLEMLEQVFGGLQKAIWEYRFICRELPLLLAQDEGLKARFKEVKQKRAAEILQMLKSFQEAGLMRPMTEEEESYLVRMIWLLSLFWLPFLEIMDMPINPEAIQEKFYFIHKLVEPFFIPAVPSCCGEGI